MLTGTIPDLPQYRILGPMQIAGDPAIGGPKPKSVLIRLLLEPGVFVSLDELVDAVWNDRPPADAAKNVQIYVARMRKVLPFGLITSGNGGYLAACSKRDVDACRYEISISEARAAASIGARDEAITRYASADALWRGAVLVDVRYASFAQSWIAFYEQLREVAREEEMALRLERGEGPQLVPRLHALVEEAPLRERRWGQLMLALYQAGQHAEALRTSQRLRQLFAEEMGLDPSPEFVELELRILRHEIQPGTSTPEPFGHRNDHLQAVRHVALAFASEADVTDEGCETLLYGDLSSALADARRRLAERPNGRAAIATSPRDSRMPAERRARALLAYAHCGELAVSQATHSALLDGELDLSRFVPVGWSDLGDGAPTAVFVEHARGTSPSVPSGANRRTNFANSGNAFLGREAELSALGDSLEAAGMVTLVGPGGIGKTRLAREYAARHMADHPDGTWLVDLASCPSRRAVWSLTSATLRVGATDPADIASRLLDRKLLLVLDNCEGSRGAVCDLAEAIQVAANDVEIIATSRTPLGCAGERVVRIGGLDGDPSGRHSAAVELFTTRAREAGTSIDLSQHATVADVCDRLDGIPLAIELAVAQLGHLSLPMLLERLNNQVEVLSSAYGRNRHRSLRAAFDTSYRLLREPARDLLTASSVLLGAFSYDDLRAVDPAVDLDAALRDLVTDSLYIAEPSGHGIAYRMLEPIRQCAYEFLRASAHADAVHLRHAEHFLDQATAGGTEPNAAHIGGKISANLLAAHDWSIRSGHDALAAKIAKTMMSPTTGRMS